MGLKTTWTRYKNGEKIVRKVISPLLFFEVYLGLVSTGAVTVFVMLLSTGLLRALMFSIFVFSYGILGWHILVSYAKKKLDERYAFFVASFAGAVSIKKNVIEALNETAKYVDEPIKSIIQQNVYLYQHGQITYDEVFKRCAEEVALPEYSTFFFLIHYGEESGSDISELAYRIVENSQAKLYPRALLRGSVFSGVVQIGLMVLVSIYLLLNATTSKEVMDYIANHFALVGFIFSAYGFAYYTVNKLINYLN